MAHKIDFSGLLKDLFQEHVPIEEKVQERPKNERNGADFSKALDAIFQGKENCDVKKFITSTKNSTDCEHMRENNFFPLQACSLYIFMRKIIMEHFGAGYDYAFVDRKGTPLKSWFSIPDLIETAKSLGYKLTIAECRAYLDMLIKQRYIETDNYKYRRCAVLDKRMEDYLQHYREWPIDASRMNLERAQDK